MGIVAGGKNVVLAACPPWSVALRFSADFRAALPAFGARINLAWADGLSLG
jgi:hypothetical protein